jgi:hypothetical protein
MAEASTELLREAYADQLTSWEPLFGPELLSWNELLMVPAGSVDPTGGVTGDATTYSTVGALVRYPVLDTMLLPGTVSSAATTDTIR